MLTSGLELPESSDTMWNIYDSRESTPPLQIEFQGHNVLLQGFGTEIDTGNPIAQQDVMQQK